MTDCKEHRPSGSTTPTPEANKLSSSNLGWGGGGEGVCNKRMQTTSNIILSKDKGARRKRQKRIDALEIRLRDCQCKELELDMPGVPLSELPDRVIKLILALDMLSEQSDMSPGGALLERYMNYERNEDQVIDELHTIMSPSK